MKESLQAAITESIKSLQDQSKLSRELTSAIVIDRTRNKEHGDFTCNIALNLAKQSGYTPRDLADLIIQNLPAVKNLQKVILAGPGFINFYLTEDSAQAIVETVLKQGKEFGRSKVGAGKKVLIEFVSANPTGPLHVGHGRGAAYGATVSDLLKAVGYQVDNEYYINDAGRQMHILATSIWLRYLELCGEKFVFPSNSYRGDYIYDIAKKLIASYQNKLVVSATEVFKAVANIKDEEDKEAYIDALILQAQTLLGKNYQIVFKLGLDEILGDIRNDLEEYGVYYQNWFSEQSLIDSGALEHGIKKLTELGFIDKKEGALWFRSTEFGDDKDRVLKRKDGRTTYFASDVAYHLNKIERGYHIIIDVLGADHHGYIPRVRAAMRALGINDKNFITPIVQFATLYRKGAKVQMSTRSGSFVTLRELREEIGKDAARFYYVMRKVEQHMDFDLDLAKSQTNENPVFYIQYAYARICSVLRQLVEQKLSFDQESGLKNLPLLSHDYEINLLKGLEKYPEVLLNAATQYEPHILINYLRELAQSFHAYYNAEQFIVTEENLRNARLCLITAVRQVLANALILLSVSTPEKM
ncbi:MAG: arginine--tRNA ligase [Gammaproteobacteria bacterium RIFCSPHIGHO2_12_FULL_35_23]|nr:MAG: arginine--tRNA ligase [Gammaproteobacteria bacterium RIFCSPHIGHO2_12_FULL_35_23]